MDIISLLPKEVSHYILEFLSVEDLGRCLRVSKRWRDIVNCNYLWKKHCLRYGVEVATHNDTSDPSDFSYWANAWRVFGCSPAYKWHANKFETLQFSKVRSYYCGFSCYKNYFAAYSVMYNCLDIYSVVKWDSHMSTGSKVKLITCLALCFPESWKEEDVALFMTEDHIIIGKCNIVLVYTKKDNYYDLFKAVSLNYSQQFATRDIFKFVENKFIPHYYIEIFGIIENNLFINNVDDETSYVLNILTNELKNIVCYDTCSIMNKFFVTWSNLDIDDILRLYDSKGNNIILLDHISCIEEVVVNDSLICVQRGGTSEENVNHIDVRDLETGRIQFSTKTSLDTWPKLHPFKEILYLLEESICYTVYRITAWDIRTGNKLWVFDDEVPTYSYRQNFITFWSLHVVCENYLVFWPLICGSDQYACIDSRTGKILYKGTKLTQPREINYVTDTLWLCVSGSSFEAILRSYL